MKNNRFWIACFVVVGICCMASYVHADTGTTSTSISELQQRVIELTRSLIIKMTAALGSTNTAATSNTTSECQTLTTDLAIGSTGSQVTLLTSYLVTQGFLSSATATFDQTVHDAVVAFQEKYASDILTPNSLIMGTGYVGQSTRAFINNVLCGTTSTSSANNITSTSDGKNVRYVKININKEHTWIALWEVEVYDTDGNKVTGTNTTVTASSDWNYVIPKDATVGTPAAIVDGNENVGWNAGETHPGCDWGNINLSDCFVGRSQSAWIELDLGKTVDIGRIRMLNIGYAINETTDVYVKGETSSYAKYASLSGPEYDRQWLEYPSQYNADPAVTLTINGLASTTVKSSEFLKYDWSTTNADYLTMEYSNDGNAALSDANTSQYCHASGVADGISMVPFYASGGYLPTTGKFVMNGMSGSEYKQAYATGCYEGHNTVTLVAHQRASGKTARATVDINYIDQTKTLPKTFDINVNNSHDKITVTRGGTTDDIITYPYYYPDPTIDLGPNTKVVSVPDGITITKGAIKNVGWSENRIDSGYWFFTQTLTFSASSSMTPGQYVVKLGAYDESDPKALYYYDLLLTVQ